MIIQTKPFGIILPVVLFLFFAGCGQTDSSQKASETKEEALGGKKYGGVFRMNEDEYFRSLFPLNITEVTGHRITNQVYEGLVGLDQENLSLIPVLAESWTIDEDAKGFNFKLRPGVFFHDDDCFPNGKGREMNIDDVIFCLHRLCTPDVSNQGFWIFKDRVKGATAFYENHRRGLPVSSGVEGIIKVDEQTLRIELEQPFGSFLYLMALPFTAIYPREAWEKYGADMRTRCVGTGPFRIKALKEDEAVVLVRNESYWMKDEHGNRLPFLDGIKTTFIKEKKAEQLEFRQANLDMVYRLPLEQIDDIVTRDGQLKGDYQRFVLQRKPSLTVQYYGFLHPDELFSNLKVRQAFNYAIDRKSIVEYTLRGTGVPGDYGIVPPAFPGYPFRELKGFSFDPEKARSLLAEAGFPGGKGFPEVTLQINSGGGRNAQVAEAIQKMLRENLGVKVNIISMPFAQHLENLETGKAVFWRSGWIADYPDPENFLNLMYSVHIPDKLSDKSYINSTRFRNARFDSLFQLALQTTDDEKRMQLYREADQVVIDRAAIMPVFYDIDYRLLQPWVRNFPMNAMEYRNFREVWFDKSGQQK